MAFAASAPPLGWPASKARLCGVCAQGSMHQARQTRGMIHHKGKMAASCRTYRQARGSFMCITNTPDLPVSNVGVDGGDVWTGQRVSNEELELIVDEACSMSVRAPVIAQYYPGRGWLWHQWHRTIVRRTLPREVLGNIIFAFAVCMMFQGLGPTPWGSFFDHKIEGLAKAWALSNTMASLMLSFFLSQSYALWRSAYSVTRRVQSRLNDFGLMCASLGQRNEDSGQLTPETEQLLGLCLRANTPSAKRVPACVHACSSALHLTLNS
jgi:hypothetical protein